MRRPPEKTCRRGAVTSAFVVPLALAAVASAAWFMAAPAHRDLVARIIAAVVVAYAWGAALRVLHTATAAAPPSKFDLDLHRPPLAPQFDPLFLRLREELARSIRSQAYFAHVLWPRLVVLSRQNDSPMPSLSHSGRLPWRGPPLEELDRLIARMKSGTMERP